MKSTKPPYWVVRLVNNYCREDLSEAVLGDLEEIYLRRIKYMKKWKADLLFLFNALQFLQPFALKNKVKTQSNPLDMIAHYFKIGLRNMLRTKAYSFLNVTGLAIGMTCSFLILLWVKNELSYDKFHNDSEKIYRFITYVDDFKAAVSAAGMGPELSESLSEINSVVRISKYENVLMDVNDIVFEERKVLFVDSNFFDFFDFELLAGKETEALSNPNALILSEELARKYFGDSHAIGQTVKVNNKLDMIVSGVLRNLPSNSHLKFDALIPMSAISNDHNDLKTATWDTFNFYTYFKLNKNYNAADQISLEEKIDLIYDQHQEGSPIRFKLEPLEDIHLYSDLQIDIADRGNVNYVRIFSIVSIFILVIAIINFVNLATARSSKRAREIGLRKSIGARRSQLIGQFLGESTLMTIIASLLTVLLISLTLPYFNHISGENLIIDFKDQTLWLGFTVIMVLTSLFSGIYPALFLSGFHPLNVLQGKFKISKTNTGFRNILVIVQFIISTTMVIGTFVIFDQLQFIQNVSLGFDKSNLITVPFKGQLWEKREVLKSNLDQNMLTDRYSIISEMPTKLTTGTLNTNWDGKDENDKIVIPDIQVDANFIDVFQIELLKGTNFAPDLSSEENSFIINETMMKVMGKNIDNILGQELFFHDNKGFIIGVVKDFNFKPLQYDIEPLVLRKSNYGNYLVIKTTINQTADCINELKDIHENLNPSFPFDYFFVDSDLENLYLSEHKMGTIMNHFAFLAIIISCLGLYGLSAYTAEQRTKEIGIRKILGAGWMSLINNLSREFLKLLLISIVIAIPLSWFLMDKWLQEFAYRTTISSWIFAITTIGLIFITLLTIGHQVLRVVSSNPIKCLKDD